MINYNYIDKKGKLLNKIFCRDIIRWTNTMTIICMDRGVGNENVGYNILYRNRYLLDDWVPTLATYDSDKCVLSTGDGKTTYIVAKNGQISVVSKISEPEFGFSYCVDKDNNCKILTKKYELYDILDYAENHDTKGVFTVRKYKNGYKTVTVERGTYGKDGTYAYVNDAIGNPHGAHKVCLFDPKGKMLADPHNVYITRWANQYEMAPDTNNTRWIFRVRMLMDGNKYNVSNAYDFMDKNGNTLCGWYRYSIMHWFNKNRYGGKYTLVEDGPGAKDRKGTPQNLLLIDRDGNKFIKKPDSVKLIKIGKEFEKGLLFLEREEGRVNFCNTNGDLISNKWFFGLAKVGSKRYVRIKKLSDDYQYRWTPPYNELDVETENFRELLPDGSLGDIPNIQKTKRGK